MFLKNGKDLDHFQLDSQGRKLFFPWGFWGSGFVVENQEQEKDIINFRMKIDDMSIFYYLLLPTVIGFFILLWYYGSQADKVTKNLQRSTEKFNFYEKYKNVINSKKLSTFIIRTLISLLLFILAFFMLKFEEDNFSKIWCIFAMVLFLYASLLNGCLILLKIKQDKSK